VPAPQAQPRFAFTTAAGAPGEGAEAATRTVYEGLRPGLERQGMSLADVVRTRLFFSSRDSFRGVTAARAPLFEELFADGEYPSTGGFVAAGGEGRPAFEVDAVAFPGRRAVEGASVGEPGAPRPPVADVNLAGEVAFLSGRTAAVEDGVEVDPGAQARAVLEATATALAGVGTAPERILALTVFVAERAAGAGFAAVEAEIESFLRDHPGPPPAIVRLGAEALVFPGRTVGFDAVAALPGASAAGSGDGDARAVRCGGLLVGAAAATSSDPATAAAEAAWALAARVADLGAPVSPAAAVGVWSTFAGSGAELLARLRAELVPYLAEPELTLRQMGPARDGDTLVLELHADCPEINPEEKR
jgi:enamine deaminase RidA (YjgF/YER057c/UK114 family)